MEETMKIECDDCKECIEQGVDYCLHLLTTHGDENEQKRNGKKTIQLKTNEKSIYGL